MGTVSQFPIKEKPRKKTKIKLRAKILFGIFIVLFISLIALKLYSFILPFFAKIEKPQFMLVEEGIDISALLIRDEKVVTAPLSGEIKYLISEGERVSVGTIVAEIHSLSGTSLERKDITTIKAKAPGTVSFYTDGWEKTLTLGVFPELSSENIEKIQEDNPKDSKIKEKTVQSGDVIFKIVNNLINPTVYLNFPIETFSEPLQQGNSILLRSLTGNKELFKGYITELKGIGDTAHVLVKLDTKGEQILEYRRLPVKLIQKSKQGVAIPVSSLIKDGDDYKVLLLNKGYTQWKKVELVDIIGEKAFVKDMTETMSIVVNPNLFKEGQRLR